MLYFNEHGRKPDDKMAQGNKRQDQSEDPAG